MNAQPLNRRQPIDRTPPLSRQFLSREMGIIAAAFVLSRVLAAWFGIHMRSEALYSYWQYLDVETLRHQLLQGLWYDHAQPPIFNALLGVMVKISGDRAPLLFSCFFKAVTLANACLLLAILHRLVTHRFIPLLLTLLYLLSPATLIFETELFYTTFISMLLLVSIFFLLRLGENDRWTTCWGVCLPLVILCLTRSLYHILWIAIALGIVLFYLRKKTPFKKMLIVASFSLLLVASWYIKNFIVFHQFSTSSWIGMNVARTVFHDHPVKDSSRIEAFEPFSDLKSYRPFIQGNAKQKYSGLDDRDLLQPYKNDTFLNENQIDYIEISGKYMKASKQYVAEHPFEYGQNVLQSAIIFFAPATRYPFAEPEAKKIKTYDILYSFNLSHFAKGKSQRRIALIVSALPKILIYLFVAWSFLLQWRRQGGIGMVNFFIFATIGFVFLASSLIEHYENMRFRYEIEPLFLVLLGQSLFRIWSQPIRRGPNAVEG